MKLLLIFDTIQRLQDRKYIAANESEPAGASCISSVRHVTLIRTLRLPDNAKSTPDQLEFPGE